MNDSTSPYEVWRLGSARSQDVRVSDHPTLGAARAAVAELREQGGVVYYEIRQAGRPVVQRSPRSVRGTYPSLPAVRPKSTA